MLNQKIQSVFSLLAAVIVLLLAGCAQVPPEKDDPRDPLQSMNRPIYDFNMDVLDAYVLRPAAVGYSKVTPQPVRNGLVNATNNLDAPIDATNSLLQGKVSNSGVSVARFLVNSTVGIFGIFDVASEIGLVEEPEDFGQTLGVWGADNGPYLMFPAYGPSTARNISGDVMDAFVLPSISLGTPATIGKWVIKVLEARASLIPQEALLNESLDPYLFMKDIYLQRQLYELHDGNPPLPKVEKTEEETANDDFFENL
ncbi:putative phospholipid-binding lipoprotein MlaA precursor [Pseudoalteromonas sp. P1-9]|uniref:MlaA family lipoprotein n=1 Tax=Pseudoalteromonas sp. P1-9 TaxID=1710354 RepID=UPI000707AE6E|nr:VacJ family lipoprotein [Pseudoalteromonas sp. P1-9]KPV97611.1 putative phospholipid-binding lipoprotein MlaA precursor [Pseudoalteromonas sp. P1-9]